MFESERSFRLLVEGVADYALYMLDPSGIITSWNIERDGIDRVFSDIVMPGRMDGLSLTRRLREVRPGLPILLVTGYSDAAADVRGDFPILRKPYEIHQLSQAIANLPR